MSRLKRKIFQRGLIGSGSSFPYGSVIGYWTIDWPAHINAQIGVFSYLVIRLPWLSVAFHLIDGDLAPSRFYNGERRRRWWVVWKPVKAREINPPPIVKARPVWPDHNP